MKMTIKRIAYTKYGTFGVFIDDTGVPFALTLERTWKQNQPSIDDVPGSCVPAGKYKCKRVDSPKFGDTFEVTGVSNRSNILFHQGNLMADSHGCILVGEQFEPLHGIPAIQASEKAFDEFKKKTIAFEEFDLDLQGDKALEFDVTIELLKIKNAEIKRRIREAKTQGIKPLREDLQEWRTRQKITDGAIALYDSIKEAHRRIQARTPKWERILKGAYEILKLVLRVYLKITTKVWNGGRHAESNRLVIWEKDVLYRCADYSWCGTGSSDQL